MISVQKMLVIRGLRFRISVAFFLISALLSLLAISAVVGVLHAIEHRYINTTLNENLNQMVQARLQNPDSRLPFSTSLKGYAVPVRDIGQLPERIRSYGVGTHEISATEGPLHHLKREDGEDHRESGESTEHDADENRLHLAVRDHGDTRFVLTFDATDIREFQSLLETGLWAGALVFSLLSLWLGYWGSGRVISPVRALANEVRSLDDHVPASAFGNTEWGSDEVGQLADAFGQYARRLEAFVERERRFTGDVSHELRNPIMLASSALDVLENAELQAADRLIVQRIRLAVSRMGELVNVFLDLAREESKAGRAMSYEQNVTVQLETTCAEVVSRYEDQVRRKGITMDFHAEKATMVEASRPALAVVIDNLLGNAVKHTAAGAVTVRVFPDRVEIADTGPGIDGEDLDRLYDRSFRGINADDAGYGLGLSIVRRLCAQNNWEVSLQNRPEGGTLAVLKL